MNKTQPLAAPGPLGEPDADLSLEVRPGSVILVARKLPSSGPPFATFCLSADSADQLAAALTHAAQTIRAQVFTAATTTAVRPPG